MALVLPRRTWFGLIVKKEQQIISWHLYPWTFQVLANPSPSLELVLHCSAALRPVPAAPARTHPPVLHGQLGGARLVAEHRGAAGALCWGVCWKSGCWHAHTWETGSATGRNVLPIKPVNWLWFERLILPGSLVTWLGGPRGMHMKGVWIENASHPSFSLAPFTFCSCLLSFPLSCVEPTSSPFLTSVLCLYDE